MNERRMNQRETSSKAMHSSYNSIIVSFSHQDSMSPKVLQMPSISIREELLGTSVVDSSMKPKVNRFHPFSSPRRAPSRQRRSYYHTPTPILTPLPLPSIFNPISFMRIPLFLHHRPLPLPLSRHRCHRRHRSHRSHGRNRSRRCHGRNSLCGTPHHRGHRSHRRNRSR